MPKKWLDVYPQGTKEGDEEQRFFIALERHKVYEWRSVTSLAQAANLSEARVEQIIAKYQKHGIVVPSPTNEDNWGYWERVANSPKKKSVLKQDQDSRIDKKKAAS